MNDRIPTWGLWLMFVSSLVGVYLLGKEIIVRGWKL